MYQTMTQQQPQIYQPMPQQPPPNYASAVQSPSYSTPVAQQPTNTNTSKNLILLLYEKTLNFL
jgi:hypothetical protein